MLIEGVSSSRLTDLRNACKRLTLKAADLEEYELLSELFRVFIDGGKITIRAAGSDRGTFVWQQPVPKAR